jgi:hypothetical protein
MMRETGLPIRLANSERIEDTLGTWPSFHDAEILTISLDRDGPSISLKLLLCPAAGRVDAGGSEGQVCWTTTLRFFDVDDVRLEAFNYQNVVWSLTLSAVEEERFATGKRESRIRVAIASVFGCECSFNCGSGEVVDFLETEMSTGHPHHLS